MHTHGTLGTNIVCFSVFSQFYSLILLLRHLHTALPNPPAPSIEFQPCRVECKVEYVVHVGTRTAAKVTGDQVNYTQIEIDDEIEIGDETQFSRNNSHTTQCKIILRMMINISQQLCVSVCVCVSVSQLLAFQSDRHHHRCCTALVGVNFGSSDLFALIS